MRTPRLRAHRMGRAGFSILSVLLAAACIAVPVMGKCEESSHIATLNEDGTAVEATVVAQADRTGPAQASSDDEFGNVTEEEAAGEQAETGRVSDPLEPMNRVFFTVNDKLYFWALKPAATGYKKVIPEDFRVLFSNFYKNISAPIRIVNKLVQLKGRDAGTEFTRLAINSTIGIGGLRDCADQCFGIRPRDADFGQTLGFYGVGQGIYFVWPFLGPSTARDTAGFGFDYFFYPTTWYTSFPVSMGVRLHDRVNSLSFHLGDYEALKKAAIDPYLSIRNAYIQYRSAFVAQAKAGDGNKDKDAERERKNIEDDSGE